MKMTKREQTLLWVFVNIFVFLIGIKILFPKVNDYYQTSMNHLRLKEEERLRAEILLLEEKDQPRRLKQSQEELKTVEALYFSKLNPEYIQSWMMSLSKLQATSILALNIEEPRLAGEEGSVEILPIEFMIEGETESIITFMNRLLNAGRYVVIDELSLEKGKAKVKLAIYRTHKAEDELERILFNLPTGRPFFMN